MLIDSQNTKRRRNLGPTSDSQAEWSPDSRYLLIAKPQWLQCGPYLWSLQTIDVQTGKRTGLKSAHCKIYQNATGWLSRKILR